MSDLSEYQDALNGGTNPPPSSSPPMSDLEQHLAVFGEGVLRTPANVAGMISDVGVDALNIAKNTFNKMTLSDDPKAPLALPGIGPAAQAIGQSFSKAEDEYTHGHTPRPKSDLDEYLNAAGQGIGMGVLAGPEAGIKAVAGGLTGSLASEGVHKAGGSDVASYLAGLGAGAVPFAFHAPTVNPVEVGSAHPDFDALANRVVPALEGGGTLENPRVNQHSGAMGVMQVTPETAANPGYGIKPWDGVSQEDLARVGRDKLAAMLHKYNGDVDKSLAAYNWGEGHLDAAIEKHGDAWFDHAPSETQHYVIKGRSMLGMDSGSTGGPVAPMNPADIAQAMGESPETTAMLAEPAQPSLPNESNVIDMTGERGDQIWNENDKLINGNLDTAYKIHQAIDRGLLNEDHIPNIESARDNVKGIQKDFADQLSEEQHGRLQDNVDLLNQAIQRLDPNVGVKDPNVFNRSQAELGIAKDTGKLLDEIGPRTPANDTEGKSPVDIEIEKQLNTPENLAGAKQVWEQAHEEAMAPHQQPDDYNSAITRQNGGTGRKFTMSPDEAQAVLAHADEAVRKYWQDKADAIKETLGGGKEPPQEPPSGGNGMGGNFGGGGGEEPPAQPEGDKYVDSVNLNRLKITDAAKQLIRDQLLPANVDIETHADNITKAMSYIDRNGIDKILSGFHQVHPDELAHYQTAVRAISSAAKENEVSLARQFPDSATRTPVDEAQLKNAIEMSGRATTLDNMVAKQLGRSMSARRIYMGGNDALGKLLDSSHLNGDSLDKIVKLINSMPEQAGDIAADALKPGWADYVKSAYYGISLLSRLSTPIGIFASIMANHVVEAMAHTLGALGSSSMEPRAWGAWEKGWIKGINQVPDNVSKAWKMGIPTDKATMMGSKMVKLPGILGFSSKLIAAVDETFGTLGRSAKSYSDAGQRAYSEGFRGADFTKRVEEIVNNPTPHETAAAQMYGKMARLQDPGTPLGRLFQGAVNSNHAFIKIPATLAFPFVNIADRLFMEAMRLTPGLSFTDRYTRADWASGTPGKFVATSRQLIGAGIASYAVAQMLAGNLTGTGPSDRGKYADWRVTHQPNSVKIDGKWVSYERLPFASLASAAATAAERFHETKNSDGYIKAIEGMFMGAGSGLLHAHYLEGVSNLADTFSSGSSDKVADFFGRTVKSMIPGLAQQINEAAVDPVMRDTKGSPFLDNIKSGIFGHLPFTNIKNPIGSETLPARHDVYGDTMHYEGGLSKLVNPFPYQTIKGGVYQQIDHLNNEAGVGVITAPSHNVKINGVERKLSEKGYQKYQAVSGGIFKQLMSQSVGEFHGMSTEDKVKLVKSNLRQARAQARAQIWGASE